VRRQLFLLAISIALGGSCIEPTEILLEITTDIPCGDAGTSGPLLLKTIIQTGTSTADLRETAATTTCRDSTHVGSIGLVPGREDEPLYVEVDGIVSTSPQPLRAARLVHYVHHSELGLSIDLSLECIDKMCAPDETCSKGTCIPVQTCISGCDARGDGTMDAIKSDAMVDAQRDVIDAADGWPLDGGCEPPFDASIAKLYWPFNEPVSSTTTKEFFTKNISTLVLDASLIPSKTGCGNALDLPGIASQTLIGCTANPCFGGDLYVAFWLNWRGGSGKLLAHGTGTIPGAWDLDVSNAGALTFRLNYSNTVPDVLTTNQAIQKNIWNGILIGSTSGLMFIIINKINAGSTQHSGPSSLPSETTYDVFAAQSGIQAQIDELYLAH